MAKHALLSPSSAVRWSTCPGSVLLSKGIVESSSEYADEGTAAHFLASQCLITGNTAGYYIGHTVFLLLDDRDNSHFERFDDCREDDTAHVLNKFKVDEDMAENVQVYLDYVRDVVKSTGGVLLVEQSLGLEHITGEKDAAGTSDAVIITEEEVIIIDLKYGQGEEVSAENNPQLLMYASGALNHYGIGADFKTVRVAISQPRVSHAPSEWSCTVEELRNFEVQTQGAAACAMSCFSGAIEPFYFPSEKACRWCKAKAQCPALDKFVQDTIGAGFDNLLLEPTPAVPDAELPKKMACLDLIEGWCKAIRSKVESELLLGHEVEGWKLVRGRKGSRAWTSADAAEALLKSMRLKVDEMYDFTLISPTTCEKVLKENPKKWARAQELIGQSEGKASVAPASDKRPAINVAPSSDGFDVVNTTGETQHAS